MFQDSRGANRDKARRNDATQKEKYGVSGQSRADRKAEKISMERRDERMASEARSWQDSDRSAVSKQQRAGQKDVKDSVEENFPKKIFGYCEMRNFAKFLVYRPQKSQISLKIQKLEDKMGQELKF